MKLVNATMRMRLLLLALIPGAANALEKTRADGTESGQMMDQGMLSGGMMDGGMMGGGMMFVYVLFGLLAFAALVLAILALIKYLRSGKL